MLVIYLSIMDNDEQRGIFAERYEKYRYECFRVAKAILHDDALSEDAVHEAFVTIAVHRRKYLSLPCRDFRRSIVIIVRNKCIDILRKEKRSVEFPNDDNIFESIGDEPDTLEQIIHRADVQEASTYINQLDQISRQILYLKYVQGLSYKEIGAELDMAIKTVEVRIARAKKKVRDLMTEGGGNNG